MKNLVNVDPKNANGWISVARVEELDGKLSISKECTVSRSRALLAFRWLMAGNCENGDSWESQIDSSTSCYNSSEEFKNLVDSCRYGIKSWLQSQNSEKSARSYSWLAKVMEKTNRIWKW